MSNTYLIPVQEVKDSTFIDDNIDDKMIKVAITDAQDMILEPILGSLLYEKLLSDVRTATITSDYQLLLVNHIWPVLLQATIYKLSYNLLLRLTNSSIVKDSNANSTAISVNELNVLIQERELSMNYHIKKLKKHLSVNQTKYPEYFGSQPDDGDSPDYTEDSVGFWDYDDNYSGSGVGPSTRN